MPPVDDDTPGPAGTRNKPAASGSGSGSGSGSATQAPMANPSVGDARSRASGGGPWSPSASIGSSRWMSTKAPRSRD